MTTELIPSPSLVDNPNCADWLDLSVDGRVLLKTSKVEIGQGILTALVQIAADELGIDPSRFDVLSGDTKLSPIEAQTSSSLSIEVTGRAVRYAASAVRERLTEEAATLLQARVEEISFVDGHVRVGERETPLTSWSLAEKITLDVPVLDFAAPKPASARHLIGTSMPRIDLRGKAVTPAFIQDITLDGMLHGRVLQPPSFESRIISFDRAALAARFPNDRIVQDGSFVGVISDDESRATAAIAAAGQLTTWRSNAEVPADLLQAIAETEAPEDVVFEAGDEAVPSGKHLSVNVRKAFMAHASIAPSCAIATWNSGRLEVLSHSQGPHGLRDGLAIAFGLNPTTDVIVTHKPGAGTYGHSGQDDVALDAALLARTVPGRPVRVVWSRTNDFVAAPLGPGMSAQVEGVLDGAGKIASLKISSHSQPHAQRPGREGLVGMTSGSLTEKSFPWRATDDVPLVRGGGAERNAVPLYAIPHLRVSKRIIKDLPIRTSALRGLGACMNVFALEGFMDDAASSARVDPVRFRLDHLEDQRARAVISRAADMADWPGAPGASAALGIGFAQYKNKSAYCAVVARVELGDTVRVTHIWSAVDAGEAINPDGVVNQVEGGIIQATSWTLKEAVQFAGDRIVSATWSDYPILRFSEVPEIHVALIDHPDLPPLGVGETSIGPTAAAIGNAVCRALGVRVCEMPITREAIVAAINA